MKLNYYAICKAHVKQQDERLKMWFYHGPEHKEYFLQR